MRSRVDDLTFRSAPPRHGFTAELADFCSVRVAWSADVPGDPVWCKSSYVRGRTFSTGQRRTGGRSTHRSARHWASAPTDAGGSTRRPPRVHALFAGEQKVTTRYFSCHHRGPGGHPHVAVT